MAEYNIVMPKMGESIQEATITRWLKQAGEAIEEDDVLLEIATDKVDSEIPSPVAGVIAKVLFTEGSKVPVGEVIAVINTEGNQTEDSDKNVQTGKVKASEAIEPQSVNASASQFKSSGRFYSPLVQSIARKENMESSELDSIEGSGRDGRVRKKDILHYLETRTKQPIPVTPFTKTMKTEAPKVTLSLMPGDEVIEMDRMRKLIAEQSTFRLTFRTLWKPM
jgi:2-oxoglutarate dehydrogenase E2 component (dihydrolipoamide succinyltransferase)